MMAHQAFPPGLQSVCSISQRKRSSSTSDQRKFEYPEASLIGNRVKPQLCVKKLSCLVHHMLNKKRTRDRALQVREISHEWYNKGMDSPLFGPIVKPPKFVPVKSGKSGWVVSRSKGVRCRTT
jgi:hypothetical protein